MIGLPKTTEFNKRIPKQTFYENLDVSSMVKKFFVDQIRVIYWKNSSIYNVSCSRYQCNRITDI